MEQTLDVKRVLRPAGPVIAALCVLALLVGVTPARAMPAQQAASRAQLAPGTLTAVEADDEVTITLENERISEVPSDLLVTWMDEISNAAPVLSDAIKQSFAANPVDMGASGVSTEPWITFDGKLSLSIPTNSISLVIPVDSAQIDASFWQRLLAAAGGLLVQYLVRTLCYAAFQVGSVFAGPFCAVLGAFSGTMFYQALVIFADGKQADPKQWAEGFAFAVVAALGAGVWEGGLNEFAKNQVRPLFEDILDSIRRSWINQKIKSAIDWLEPYWSKFTGFLSDAFTRAHSTSGLPGGDRPLRIMVVGDSMSQGHEGDYTWRYRLWQWLQDQRVAVDFVGPYDGTRGPDPAGPPQPPPLQGAPTPAAGPPRADGGYAADAAPFDSQHFAIWGRQAAQDKDLIREQVANYQPDILLVGLGFNDMGWFVSGPEGTLASMRTLVDNARAAKPDLKLALANVPQRTKINGRDDLPVNTDTYNRMLAAAIPTWSTTASPVKLVDWRGNYSCEVNACPAGYDGLHPNARGEYEIAGAFAQTLHSGYGLGTSAPTTSGVLPSRPTPIPSGVSAEASPLGFTVTWEPVYGAFGYTVRSRIAGTSTWNEFHVSTNRYDNSWVLDSQQWEAQVRTDNGDHVSGWSDVVSTTVHPQTAPGPADILTLATPAGFDIRWDPPTGDNTSTIERYAVLTYDLDTPGAFVNRVGIRGRSASIDGLVSGHRYLVAVESWNAAGGGLPAGARGIVVGGGTPPTPTDLTVTATDLTTVQLAWNSSAEVGGYEVTIRNINDGSVSREVANGTTHGIAFLFPGYWNYEFCVRAFNGIQTSGSSNCVTLPPPTTAGRPNLPPAAEPTPIGDSSVLSAAVG